MRERSKPRQSMIASGPSGLGSLFAPSAGDDASVAVTSGPYAEDLPVGEMTVGEIRERFRDRFNIDPRSQAILDGNEVDVLVVLDPVRA